MSNIDKITDYVNNSSNADFKAGAIRVDNIVVCKIEIETLRAAIWIHQRTRRMALSKLLMENNELTFITEDENFYTTEPSEWDFWSWYE